MFEERTACTVDGNPLDVTAYQAFEYWMDMARI
jgi:hypothetical protein